MTDDVSAVGALTPRVRIGAAGGGLFRGRMWSSDPKRASRRAGRPNGVHGRGSDTSGPIACRRADRLNGS
ncbi:hypothetical protein [Chelatococcus asaccharovorans]|uniref:Uncharacterized protein n=1 Tax=Chelatococcus asaccharovorans TaxID=28210 RepID=A0A2V3UHY8_9HYPH|nr:hypothetical protein [Chelatococcus asaccharovorans]MBS7706446.1 hypothetical protein [Chelatococcus asaccharovorans]PXW64911.1 hypothetical protein C7450_101671 [Chelatococcus asaccharovorans]